MQQPGTLTLAVGFTLISMSSTGGERLLAEQECAVAKVQASAEHYHCLANVRIRGIQAKLADAEVTRLIGQCTARYRGALEDAEARAASQGDACDTAGSVSDARPFAPGAALAAAMHEAEPSPTEASADTPRAGKSAAEAANIPALGAGRACFGESSCPRGDQPRIPKEDFEWNGRFKVKSLKVSTDLTIRGKWQGRYFDLYMAQGGRNSRVWVENLIYRNKLYTITHKWPGGVKVPGCYRSQNDITVDDLNGILRSSRLVGPERINGIRMKHFRATCLSETSLLLPSPLPPLTTPLQIFSDIYVRPGRPTQFERWLQFGDGVGLDPQRDEWFFLQRHHHRPAPIVLPWLCEVLPLPVEQKPCRNLTPSPK